MSEQSGPVIENADARSAFIGFTKEFGQAAVHGVIKSGIAAVNEGAEGVRYESDATSDYEIDGLAAEIVITFKGNGPHRLTHEEAWSELETLAMQN